MLGTKNRLNFEDNNNKSRFVTIWILFEAVTSTPFPPPHLSAPSPFHPSLSPRHPPAACHLLQINGQLLCGFTGLWTDALTVMQNVASEVALKGIEDDRPISPAAFAGLLSTLLYSRRRSPFFVEPIIAGLDSRGRPYLCGQVRSRACCRCLWMK